MEKTIRLVLEHKDSGKQKVIYLKPLNDEDDYVLHEDVDGRDTFHVLVDEGYANTHYWYETKLWYIRQLSVMVEE